MAIPAVVAAAYLAAAAWLLWWVLLAVGLPFWTPVVITSGSMRPAINDGDLVIAATVDPASLVPGDVVVVTRDDGSLVTHRIVSIEPDGRLRTRGDANAVVDSSPVSREAVLGRGRLLVPGVGLPLVWARRGDWTALVLWSAASVLAVWCLRRWWEQQAATRLPATTWAARTEPAAAWSRRRPVSVRDEVSMPGAASTTRIVGDRPRRVAPHRVEAATVGQRPRRVQARHGTVWTPSSTKAGGPGRATRRDAASKGTS